MEASIAEKCLDLPGTSPRTARYFPSTLSSAMVSIFEFSTVEKRNTLHNTEQKIKKPSLNTLKRNRKKDAGVHNEEENIFL